MMFARPGKGDLPWQPLDVHLREVGDLAATFAAKFDAEPAGRLLGLTHDLAKAGPGFQRRLRQASQGKRAEEAPHAYPGAAAVRGILGPLAVCVQGHHSQMRDADVSKQGFKDQDPEAVRAATALAISMGIKPIDWPAWTREYTTRTEMFVRMCFSCLIDADRLNSEAFDDPEQSRGGYPGMDTYLGQLRAKVERFPVDDRPIIAVRREVQAACVESAALSPGFFRLTVPTGGGKTLASLRFALEHAVRHGQERVVVAIPFTSIIEQTASIYADIFGEENVLAHHSADPIVADDEEADFDVRRKNAAENWDIPLVVTTNVRLFDGLFGNRPAQCRRLHNLARSVIVLDEPQSLPTDLLEPCLDALSWLVRYAGTTVVFCTATQPDYSVLPNLPDVLREAREIVPNPERHFAALSRVEYRYVGKLTHAQVADRLRQTDQGLCILNSRKDSLEVFAALGDPDALYLSTRLCPDHRREVLEKIRHRLANGEPCRVVSTQVIECGVDVDFPLVMRAFGPLEGVVQSAGRANREGRRSEKGIVEIFDLEGGVMPPGAYTSASGAARDFIPNRLREIDQPSLHAEYYAILLGSTGTDKSIKGSDGRKTDRTVQSARAARDFQTVSREAKLIEDDTVSVVVRARDPEAVNDLLTRPMSPRKRFRELGRYMVNLRQREADHQAKQGLIQADPSGALVWVGPYSKNTGIVLSVVHDPADLIAFD